jgi:hypothetical protein
MLNATRVMLNEAKHLGSRDFLCLEPRFLAALGMPRRAPLANRSRQAYG